MPSLVGSEMCIRDSIQAYRSSYNSFCHRIRGAYKPTAAHTTALPPCTRRIQAYLMLIAGLFVFIVHVITNAGVRICIYSFIVMVGLFFTFVHARRNVGFRIDVVAFFLHPGRPIILRQDLPRLHLGGKRGKRLCAPLATIVSDDLSITFRPLSRRCATLVRSGDFTQGGGDKWHEKDWFYIVCGVVGGVLLCCLCVLCCRSHRDSSGRGTGKPRPAGRCWVLICFCCY